VLINDLIAPYLYTRVVGYPGTLPALAYPALINFGLFCFSFVYFRWVTFGTGISMARGPLVVSGCSDALCDLLLCNK
jgi:hypothetical protein